MKSIIKFLSFSILILNISCLETDVVKFATQNFSKVPMNRNSERSENNKIILNKISFIQVKGRSKKDKEKESKILLENKNTESLHEKHLSDVNQSHTNGKLMNSMVNTNTKKGKNNDTNIDINKKAINNLNTKISILMQLKSKLLKKVNKKNKIRKQRKEMGNDIVSFIQQKEQNVEDIKHKIDAKNNFINKQISDQEKEIYNLHKKVVTNFSALKNLFNTLQKKIYVLRTKGKSLINKISEKMKLDGLRISKKLKVEGSAYISHKITTNVLELGNLKIDSNKMSFYNENTKFIIGTEVLSFNEFLLNMKLIKDIRMKCGESLERCKILTQEDLRERTQRQEQILENLRALRRETEKIMTKAHS